MELIYNDGGRNNYYKADDVRDCVCRSIAIATETDYKEVYDLINTYAKSEHKGKRKKGISSARNGVYKTTTKKILEEHFGWKWHPTMEIGSGCKVHLADGELPMGRLVVQVSGHLTAVINGIINDTFDPSRDGTRCVYGYWSKV